MMQNLLRGLLAVDPNHSCGASMTTKYEGWEKHEHNPCIIKSFLMLLPFLWLLWLPPRLLQGSADCHYLSLHCLNASHMLVFQLIVVFAS